MSDPRTGVSFIVPVLNGRRTLRAAIEAILAQRDDRPFEILIVDDGSTDGSVRIARAMEAAGSARLLTSPALGPAAAVNAGIREAAHPIVCQIDQDVHLQPGWLTTVLRAMTEPGVAAAQGHYVHRRGAGLWARAMGLDLEQRYARMRAASVNHVCTGNTAYRASALFDVGLLDETLGYGADNDLSYRLVARGHRLVYCPGARSTHHWREGCAAYLRQQFGVGYGRLDVVARHPRRVGGDDVSGTLMMVHAPAMLAGWGLAAAAILAAVAGEPWRPGLAGATGIWGLLTAERALCGMAAWRRSGDRAALMFPVAHFARDCAWAVAIVVWAGRRALGWRSSASSSLLRRDSAAPLSAPIDVRRDLTAGSLLAIVPAYNEAASLPRVVADLRRTIPAADILIVNDGSSDGTGALLPSLGVAWLTLSQRVGVGGAVRAGLLYGARRGYRYAARVDGDGQHRACDIGRLLRPVVAGRADAAIGSRFMTRRGGPGLRRMSQSALGLFLTVLTGRRVTDPTSGFWLFGTRALAMLGTHHPGGYAEPELVLLLNRTGLRVTEVPIRVRPRVSGRTSLTASRAALALARTALALLVVPFRRVARSQAGD